MKINRADVVAAIVGFRFDDYSCDDFPVIDGYSGDPTEMVDDLADAIVEKLEAADSE